jgi:cell division protein FtsW
LRRPSYQEDEVVSDNVAQFEEVDSPFTDESSIDEVAATPQQGVVHDFQQARRQRQRRQSDSRQGQRRAEASDASWQDAERRVAERRSAMRNVEEFDVAPFSRATNRDGSRSSDVDHDDRRAALRAGHLARYERKKQKAEERRLRMEARRAKCPACHWGLFVLTALLAVLSVPIVYSASTAVALDTYGKANFFLIRQAGFVGLGLLVLWITSRLSQKQMRAMVWGLYAIALLGLFAIDFTPLGYTQSGVRRWIKLPGLPPQQFSELAKIALIGVMADFWSRAARPAQTSMWPWFATAALTLPIAGLVVIQPHLSAALLLCALPFAIAFYADAPMKQIGKLVVPIVLVAAVVAGLCVKRAMPFVPAYQQERIAAHFGGEADAQGSNYQTLQSQRTLMSGGIWGRGPGESLGKQGHLPEPHTDFILAVIGEEYGLVGTLVLLTGYGLMIFFCFHIGHCADSMFEALLCAGVGTLLSIQVICNAGVATGVLPVTGMPLPFMSYGGSGLLCLLIGMGLVLAVSRRLGCASTDSRDTGTPAMDDNKRSQLEYERATGATAPRHKHRPHGIPA